MQLHLTDGKSQVTTTFNELIDVRDCHAIRQSKRPVSTALKLAVRRIESQCEGASKGLYPVSGQALVGL